MTRSYAILLFAAFNLLSLTTGCRGGGGHSEAPSSEALELQAARTAWSGRSFQSYTYDIFLNCFCAFGSEHILVTVENNAVASAVHAATGEAIPDAAQSFTTIDGLFDRLQQALNDGAETYRAQFDPGLGIPVHVEVDPVAGFADDEYSWDLSLVSPASQACGPVQCASGTECCNESCGICVPPGGACIEIFCEN